MYINMLSPLEHFHANYISYIIFCSHSFFGIDSFALTFLSIFFIVFIIFFLSFHINLNFGPYGYENVFINFYLIFIQIIRSQISEGIRILRFFSLIVTTFLFIFFSNLFSLSFFTFSTTGHILITLSLSLTFFIGIIIVGLLNNEFNFFYLFYPSGVKGLLLYFLVIIEIISFFIRPFSLAIRLFANMLAGHILLNIFSSFSYFVSAALGIFFIVPFFLCVSIVVLEVGVAIIQAYVFVVLLLVYFSDIIKIGSH